MKKPIPPSLTYHQKPFPDSVLSAGCIFRFERVAHICCLCFPHSSASPHGSLSLGLGWNGLLSSHQWLWSCKILLNSFCFYLTSLLRRVWHNCSLSCLKLFSSLGFHDSVFSCFYFISCRTPLDSLAGSSSCVGFLTVRGPRTLPLTLFSVYSCESLCCEYSWTHLLVISLCNT